MDRQTCPPASLLLAFLLNQDDLSALKEIETHLASCLLCRAEVGLLREKIPADVAFLNESVPDVLRQMHQPRKVTQAPSSVPSGPAKGQIWAARSHDEAVRRLVMILEDSDDSGLLMGALISTDTKFASDRDVVFPFQESPLEYPFMIETWNQFPLLIEQSFRYLGSLDPELVPILRRLGRKGEWTAPNGLKIGLNTGDSLDVRRFQLAELDSAKALSVEAMKRVAVDLTDEPQLPALVDIDRRTEQVSLSPRIPWTRQEETVILSLYQCNVDLSEENWIADLPAPFYADHYVLLSVSWERPCTIVRAEGRNKKIVVRHRGDRLAVRFVGPEEAAWGLSHKEATAPTVYLASGVEQEIPVHDAVHLWARAST